MLSHFLCWYKKNGELAQLVERGSHNPKAPGGGSKLLVIYQGVFTARMLHEIVVAAISLGCFWNSYGGQLVFDDTLAVSGNPDTNPYSINKPWHGVFYNDFWGAPITSASSHKSYRPLCVLCFRLSRIINEDLLGSLLVYALYRSILSAFKDQLNGSKAHPIHCESVASVVGLADLMCSICGLIAIQIWIRSSLHYLKAVRNSPNTTFSYSEAAWYLAQTLIAITIVLIGTLFKETCVTWAAVFGAFDVIMLLPALTERKVSVVITSRTDLGADSTRETKKKTTAVGKPIQTKEGEDADGGEMHDNSNIQDATVLEENYDEYRADDTTPSSAPLSTITSKKNKQDDDTHHKDLISRKEEGHYKLLANHSNVALSVVLLRIYPISQAIYGLCIGYWKRDNEKGGEPDSVFLSIPNEISVKSISPYFLCTIAHISNNAKCGLLF
eukprot:jgi/Bigna1/77438/fgenesh1_pg.48_\